MGPNGRISGGVGGLVPPQKKQRGVGGLVPTQKNSPNPTKQQAKHDSPSLTTS